MSIRAVVARCSVCGRLISVNIGTGQQRCAKCNKKMIRKGWRGGEN